MFPRPPLTPVIKVMIVGLFSSFILQIVLEQVFDIDVLLLLGVFSQLPPDLTSLYRILTHVLVEEVSPSGLMWFLIGLVFLWLAGSPFELRLGARQTALVSLVGTVAAGVVTLLAGLVIPGGAIGINPIIIALIAGFAITLPPKAQLRFFGVLPLTPMGLVWVLVAFSTLFGVVARNYAGILGDVAAIFATLGYVRWLLRPRRPKPKPKKKPRNGGGRRFQVIQGGGGDEDDERPRYLN